MSDEVLARGRAEILQEARNKSTAKLREAATQLLASGEHHYVEQVHEVIIREVDAYDPKPNYVSLIPLGAVLGIQIRGCTDDNNLHPAEIKAEVYISMTAFASSLNALGLRLPAIHTCNFQGGSSERDR
jgi:hypothetical protein